MGDPLMVNYTRPGMVGSTRPGSFVERMEELKKLVGTGRIETTIRVDQVYAYRQHQHPEFSHPRGGQAFYLRKALFEVAPQYFARLQQELIRGNVQVLFIRLGEAVAEKSRSYTPIELGNLRRSDSVVTKVGGRVIYRREAAQRRLSRTELNSRVRARHTDALKRRFNS